MKNYLLISFTVFCHAFSFAQTSFEGRFRIAPWSGNKKAAACITFDDNCPGQFDYALPELNQRNLKATFFIITGASQCGLVDWAKVDSAFQKGHEIGSHSKTHLNMANSDSATIETELRDSYDTLRKRYYPEGSKMTIAYPFGRGGGSSAQDKRIRRLGQKYYYGGRSAGIGASGFTGYNDFNNNFYNAFYMQWGTFVMGPGNLPTAAQLSDILDNTMEAGGFFTGLYHGIETGGFNNMPVTTFKEHLDSMKIRESRLWITTFGKAIQYHAERRAEPRLVTTRIYYDPQNAWTGYNVVKLTDTLSGDWYKEPLTIRLNRLVVVPGIYLVDSVLNLAGARNIVEDGDTIQFDLAPGDSAIIKVILPDGVSKRISSAGISLYPNPAGGPVVLEVTDPAWKEKDLKFEVVDHNGKKCTKVEFQKGGNGAYRVIPPSSMPGGIYNILISNGKEKKIVGLDWNP